MFDRKITWAAIFLIVCSVFVVVHFGIAEDLKEFERKIHSAIEGLRLHRHSIESSYNQQGEVILSGYVSSEADREMVTREITSIPGVSSVENTLIVKENIDGNGVPPAGAPQSMASNLGAMVNANQDVIRKKALLAVKKLSGLGEYEIDMVFSEHAIELTGQAESAEDIKKIGLAIQKEAAPFGVVNKIALKPAPSDNELVARIVTAFKNEKDLQAEGISITAQNGVVTLSGEKPNHRVIDRILSIANMVNGVKRVESKIAVR